MNNLRLDHQSNARSPNGLTTTSSTISDEEQTPMCGSWRWRIPNLHIASLFRSLYFRIRGRTLVTMMKPNDNDKNDNATQNLEIQVKRSNKIEPLRPVAFSTNTGRDQSSINNKSSPVPPSSLMSGIREIRMPSRLSLPGVVSDSEVYNIDGPETDKSNCEDMIYPQEEACPDIDRDTVDLATEAKVQDSMIDSESTRNSNNDRDIIHDGCEGLSSEEKARHPVDILVFTNSPSSSPGNETSSSVEISFQENCVDMDEEQQLRPLSRLGREGKEPIPGGDTTEEADIGSSVDISKPDEIQTEVLWVKSEETVADSELEEELDYYEDNKDDDSEYLDMDKVLRKCPPTEVLQNLRDMVQLSKNTTSQLEKALRRTARISCGPFPRLPGSGFTKTEVINLKCGKLLGETEDFLGEMNKNFLTFYTVLDQMDKVSVQDSYVSSIIVNRGPCDWRRGHAAILRKMDKLWSRDYPKVITRKLKGRIQETIYEDEE